MKALIIDDEKHCSESLNIMLQQYTPVLEVIAETNDPFQGLGMIAAHKPDVIFLDIEMPHLSGFQLLSTLDKIDFEIIFTTAYDEFAIQAFKVNALDYLLKPIGREDLDKAVEKLKQRRGEEHPNFGVNALLNGIMPTYNTGKVSLPTMEGFEFVQAGDIVRCESDSNYTYIYFKDRKLTISKTLKEVQQLLEPYNFYRIHNSHLINLNHIQKYQRGAGGIVVMDNGDHVQVSRSKKADFLDRI